MCPGLPDLHLCRNRCLLGTMPREEPRAWRLSWPRMWLLSAGLGRSGLLVMQLLHLKLKSALNMPSSPCEQLLQSPLALLMRCCAAPPSAGLAAEPPTPISGKPKGALKRRCFCHPCRNWP